ncbi:benzoate-CoA ligase family protein [Alicyclobacillus pomorum]|jgi:benzoate-CoA ligase family protein|uniref:benzoate-CoA ligase family protein n=1 Tax=Alicyclobacillus pomorum TaxID=204470 RepID=UPI0004258B82|nr:benzoate-CoA ligase family protein [Alicyclobacillus pomorum]
MAAPRNAVLPLATHDLYNAASYFIDRNVELGRAEKIAIHHDDGDITYGDLRRWVNRVGHGLRGIGVQMENRVLLVCYDSVEFVASFFGAVKIGAIPIPTNTMLRPKDYVYLLNDSRAKVAVVEAEIWNQLQPVRSQLPFLEHVVVICRDHATVPAGCLEFTSWLAEQSEELSPVDTIYDDAAFWLYTSGSTGKPKGAIHLQHDMELALHHYAEGILDMTEADVTFSASKLFFAYGMGNGMYFPLGVGGTAVLMRERPTPTVVFERVERHRPTLFFGVPTLYAAMLDHVKRRGFAYDFSSVRYCVSAGEPLPPAIYHRFKETFGVDILDGIGSTEALHIYLSNRPGNVRAGSTGQVVPGYEVRIVDEAGCSLSPNQVGELLLKGDSLAQGYWNLHQQTKAKFGGEWFHTGDCYYYDEDGFFWYCGRLDDMLKSGGIWVSPIEIENVLIEHEAVLEVAVVGGRDENGIEKPVAFIVPQDIHQAPQLEQELFHFVRDRLARYKCPKRFVFVESLPKTETGKIQRFKLRDTVHV